MLEFAWKAYNKLNFDRNVKIIIARSKVSPIEKQRRKRHAKPKFYILRRWVLCHFADEKLTKA